MADSETSTTRPFVTRRHLLAGIFAATAVSPTQYRAPARASAPTNTPAPDPALSIWWKWKAASLNSAALCRKQRQLETQLVDTIGFPQAQVYLPDEEAIVTVAWPGDIEELFGDDLTFADLRTQIEADLADHQARWDAEDRRIGYSATKRAELAAIDQEQALVDALMIAPGTTLAVVAGKLDAILREGESLEDSSEFPWPQLRAGLVDLLGIGQLLQPSAFMPGSDGDEPYPRQRREQVCMSVMMYQRGDRET